jgi:hypothetical protein
MRLRVLILASFTILAFLAVLALAIDWNNPYGKSVEDLFADEEGTQSISSTSAGLAATPQMQRAALENTSNNSDIFEPIPGTLAGGGISAKESRSLAESASQNQGQTNEAPAAGEAKSVKGNWYLQLLGKSPAEVSITPLYQSGNAIFGIGTVTPQGGTALEAAASGSVNGNQISLDIVTLKSTTLYRATLTLSGETASGNYQAFSSAEDTWTGDANGSWTVPA